MVLQTRTGDPLLARSRQEVPRDFQFISLHGRSRPVALFSSLAFSAKRIIFPLHAPSENARLRTDKCGTRLPVMQVGPKDNEVASCCRKNTVVFKRFIEYIAMT
jgi:hypothetical protein